MRDRAEPITIWRDQTVSTDGHFIYDMVEKMKVGECMDFDVHFFNRAFMVHTMACLFAHHPQTPQDNFMSKIVGGAWGGVRVRYHDYLPKVTISRHAHDGKRYYADPDRQHMYTKNMQTGELTIKERWINLREKNEI